MKKRLLLFTISLSSFAFSQTNYEALKKENESLQSTNKVLASENEYLKKVLEINKPILEVEKDNSSFKIVRSLAIRQKKTLSLHFLLKQKMRIKK